MKSTIKLWQDDRAKPNQKWVLTIRRRAIVENLRFSSRAKALTYARGLKKQKVNS